MSRRYDRKHQVQQNKAYRKTIKKMRNGRIKESFEATGDEMSKTDDLAMLEEVLKISGGEDPTIKMLIQQLQSVEEQPRYKEKGEKIVMDGKSLKEIKEETKNVFQRLGEIISGGNLKTAVANGSEITAVVRSNGVHILDTTTKDPIAVIESPFSEEASTFGINVAVSGNRVAVVGSTTSTDDIKNMLDTRIFVYDVHHKSGAYENITTVRTTRKGEEVDTLVALDGDMLSYVMLDNVSEESTLVLFDVESQLVVNGITLVGESIIGVSLQDKKLFVDRLSEDGFVNAISISEINDEGEIGELVRFIVNSKENMSGTRSKLFFEKGKLYVVACDVEKDTSVTTFKVSENCETVEHLGVEHFKNVDIVDGVYLSNGKLLQLLDEGLDKELRLFEIRNK